MQTLDYIGNPALGMWHDVELCLVCPSQVQHPRRYSWGLHFILFLTYTKRGYSDGQAWIQRRQGVAIATSYSWVCIFFKKPYTEPGYSDIQAWIQRRPGVDTEMARRVYSDGLDI